MRTPSHGQAGVRRPARTYQQQLCADAGYSLADQPSEIEDRDEWRESYRNLPTNVHIGLLARPSKTTSGYERK